MLWAALGVVVGLIAIAIVWSRISFGRTARGMAVFGKAEALRALLAREPKQATEANEHGEQPMHAAAGHGHVAVIDVLLEHGASPNARCEGGGTPLTMAAFYGTTDALRRLIAAGADVDDCDDMGMTALHASVARGNVEVAKALLDSGAQLDLKDAAGRTALDGAIGLNQPDLARLLEARGARKGSQVRMRELKPPKTGGGTHRVPVAMMMPADDPGLVAARTQARASTAELERLHREKAKVAIKAALDPKQPTEKLWLAVHELEGGVARGVAVSNPVHADRKEGDPAELRLADLDDWVAELPDGSLRGGFGLKAMIAFARDEYGALSPQYAELEKRLPS